MPSPQNILTKTCSSCGLQKSLSAFVQLSGTQAVYGHICSACRKANKNKPTTAEEDSTSSRTGHTIDAKTKIKSDLDKQLFRQQIEDRNQDEREEKIIAEEKHVKKTQNTAEKEQAHRKEYLDKRSFLSKKSNIPTSTDNQFFLSEQNKTQIDPTKPVLTHVAGEIKRHSAIFNTFKAWLGASAPIVSNITQTENSAKPSSKKR